jgi:PhnB protein
MAQLNPYLTFNGNAREAMTFYQSCLGGELILNTIGESPMAAQMPKEKHNEILHSVLKNGHLTIMAADMGSADPGQGRVALCLVCSSADEIKRLFEALSADGNVDYPLKQEFFGTFGAFIDKYGVRWNLQYGTGEQK